MNVIIFTLIMLAAAAILSAVLAYTSKAKSLKIIFAVIAVMCLVCMICIVATTSHSPSCAKTENVAPANPFAETVFGQNRPHELLGKYRTFVQYGILHPAIITVYGNKKPYQNVAEVNGGFQQWGYAISTIGLPVGRISSRLQSSLEYQVGPYEITEVEIFSTTDTTNDAWKNAKSTVQW